MYQPNSDADKIFLTLLRIYLRPLSKTTDNLLPPALDLIRRHGPRLDAEETLQLLPPLVSTQDIGGFLLQSLRSPVFDTKVIRDISKARNEQIANKLMYLESNRVKVTDMRMYVCYLQLLDDAYQRSNDLVAALSVISESATTVSSPFTRLGRDRLVSLQNAL